MYRRNVCKIVIIYFAVTFASTAAFSSSSDLQNSFLTLKRDYSILVSQNRTDWSEANIGKFDEIISKARALIKDNPGTKEAVSAQKIISDCYQCQADYPAREAALDDYIEGLVKTHQRRKALKILKLKADENYNNSAYNTAIALYSRILNDFAKMDKSITEYSQCRLAECYKKTDKRETALDLYTDLISKNPEKTILRSAYSGTAYIYMRQGKWQDAAAMLEKALECSCSTHNPLSEYIQYYFGYCKQQEGKLGEAMSAYDKVRAKYPNGKYASKAEKSIEEMNTDILGEGELKTYLSNLEKGE